MSVRLIGHVWHSEAGPPTARLVLLAIAWHARDDGGGAYPSIPRLASMTGLSVRYISTALHQLENAGHLLIVRRPGVANRYIVRLTPARGARVEPLHATSEPLHATSGAPAPHVETPAPRAPEPLQPQVQPSQPQVVAVYQELYGAEPSAAKCRWLASIEDRWTADRAVAALRGEYDRNPDPRTICGRMVAGLKAGDAMARVGVR